MASDERGVQRPGLASAAESPQQKGLGTHAASRRHRHLLRQHHRGLRSLRRGERPTSSSSEERSACRHHPAFPTLLRRPHGLFHPGLVHPGLFHPGGLWGVLIRQQDHRPGHQVDRRLLAGERELSLRLFSPVRRINSHTLRQRSHLLVCQQRRGIHERRVQSELLGNGHHSGVCGHQHASAKWLQNGLLSSRRQWTPTHVVGEAHAHCDLSPQPYATLRA